jgi:predicted ATPase/DNA-binding SARP family transcriptional activator
MLTYLRLFGRPEAEYDGTSVALPVERRCQLLALLALRRGWVGRAELADLFWPDLSTERAYTNLRKVLHLARALPWASALELQSGALRFEVVTDVHDFEMAVAEGRLDDALALRRGDLLAGFDTDAAAGWAAWLGHERERLQSAWRDAALVRLSQAMDAADAVDLSGRLLDADPLDEAALRAHMLALVQDGQSARARRAYRDFVARLHEELGLPPSVELRALHDALPSGTEVASRIDVTPAEPDDGFVGRSVELRQMASLLARPECRLLTLLGPGGVGKSRLARRGAAALASQFADGKVFVPLEDALHHDEACAPLARELHVPVATKGDALEHIAQHLRDRAMLLVLDNFEHLIPQVSLLHRLLDECPYVKLVVTSRVRLGLAREWLLPLEGLPFPDPEDEDRADGFDAVRLFVKAARRVQPALDAVAERAAIVDICRQVEGLPLALEIAAAWSRVLPCTAIAAELREGTELLRSVDAARPARQASIEAVFDHSWRLLAPVERDVLARLSIFRGGFTVEAARTVAGAPLPVLAALSDKSLVRHAGKRMQLHPLVHQVAGMRLAETTGATLTARSHADYFVRMLARVRQPLEFGDRQALQEVEDEIANVRAAWRWSIATGGAEALRRGAPSLLNYFENRGRFAEALALLNEAVAVPAPALAAARNLIEAVIAQIEYRLDRYAEAEARATRAIAAARTQHDDETVLQCLRTLGQCAYSRGRRRVAKRFFEQARRRALAAADLRSASAMLDNLALIEKVEGRYDEALRLSLESLTQHRRLGDAAGAALCLNNLAVLYMSTSEWQSARVNLEEALEICNRQGIVHTRALVLANLTEVEFRDERWETAEDLCARAVKDAEHAGNRTLMGFLYLQSAQLSLKRSDVASARGHLSNGLSVAIATGRERLQLAGVDVFGRILQAQSEVDCARQIWRFAIDHPKIDAPERSELQRRLATLPAGSSTEAPRPTLELSELMHRIVAETGVAYAPLIATLRGGAQPASAPHASA